MHSIACRTGRALCVMLAVTGLSLPAVASEKDTLHELLDEFLRGASAGSVETHEKFWADELVYTSSSGARTNKPEILDNMRNAPQPESGEPEVVYTADDVDIRLYGNTAVVAFRLVGTAQSEPGGVTEYFNTGVFLKRDGRWQAVAWQATRIPPRE